MYGKVLAKFGRAMAKLLQSCGRVLARFRGEIMVEFMAVAKLWRSGGEFLFPCYLEVLAMLSQEYGEVITELWPSLAR